MFDSISTLIQAQENVDLFPPLPPSPNESSEEYCAYYAKRDPQHWPDMTHKTYLAVLKKVSEQADVDKSFLDDLALGLNGKFVARDVRIAQLEKIIKGKYSVELGFNYQKDFKHKQGFGITLDMLTRLPKKIWTQETIEELLTNKNIYSDAKEFLKHMAENINVKLLENAIQNKDKLTVKQLNECREMASSLNISFDNFSQQWQEVYPILKKMKANMERDELKERLTSVHQCFNELGQIG